jgi:putative transposase
MGGAMSSDSQTPAGGSVTVELQNRLLAGTPIGIDLGVRNLIAISAADAGPELEATTAISGRRVRQHYDRLVVHAQQERSRVDALLADQITDVVDDAVQEAISHVQELGGDVVVLEDRNYPGDMTLLECARSERDLQYWLLPEMKQRLHDAAVDAGLMVVATNQRYTTKQCHVCGEFTVVERESITCTTEDCPVDTVCRDRSAAATIAGRVH